jgi:hypothetical protein
MSVGAGAERECPDRGIVISKTDFFRQLFWNKKSITLDGPRKGISGMLHKVGPFAGVIEKD